MLQEPRLVQQGSIDSVEDVFHLSEQQLADVVSKTSDAEEIRDIVRKSQAVYAEYSRLDELPERVHQWGETLDLEYTAPELPGELRGTPCYPGKVTAPVRLLTSPSDVSSLHGDILATTSTDPGWITIFRSASAILVERGSTLSHAAIVCREMGIPCIVGIKGLMQTLTDGETVQMDGETGVVIPVKS